MRKSLAVIFVFCFFAGSTFAQLIVRPIEKPGPVKKDRHIGARDPLTAMALPFWDDFSIASYFPNDTLWQYGNRVALNYGIGVDPPSLGVVTFDGLDSLGKPYNVDNELAKGYADLLLSRAIRLDLVPAVSHNTVYLSFFFQFMGNGEAPNPGDHLDLDFRNASGTWINILTINTDTITITDKFHQLIVPVTSETFFYDQFQFRFRNYGRLSGPYDTWNLDYVYLNSGRSASDTSYPDRTIATPLTSLFTEYWAIPKKHFMTDPAANLGHPSFSIYNLKVGAPQPMNYSYRADVTTYTAGIATTVGVTLADSTSIGIALAGLERRTITVDTTLSATLFDIQADSFKIKYRAALKTKDNVPPALDGDYIAAMYAPIDFRVNDTTQAEVTLAKYYAYDDGTAEYGIGLNQSGAQVAYQFDMKTPLPDTLIAVDFYFPRFGNEASQIILFRILRDLNDDQSSILYEENMVVEKSAQNKFIRHTLTRNTILVEGSFYLGWRQSSADQVLIGWDKNTDSGSKIWVNTNGSWDQNIIEIGSMMVHPVFGKGGVITSLPEQAKPYTVFPNPTTGTFFVSGETERLEMLDMAGRPVLFSTEVVGDNTHVIMMQATPGLYVLKIFSRQGITTQKVMVRQ